jgi:hypothetical protein
MKLINYINKKLSVKKQRLIITSYLLFGYPISQIFSTLIIIYINDKIHYLSYIMVFIIIVFFLSPIIISYYLNVIKYKKLIKKVRHKNDIVVTALYSHLEFIKNEKYNVVCYDIDKNEIFVYNHKNYLPLKDNINYFDVDNLSENRKKKLKKLNIKLF